jgi:hypothetical protein
MPEAPKWVNNVRLLLKKAKTTIPGNDSKTTARDYARHHIEEALKLLDTGDEGLTPELVVQLSHACECLSRFTRRPAKQTTATAK